MCDRFINNNKHELPPTTTIPNSNSSSDTTTRTATTLISAKMSLLPWWGSGGLSFSTPPSRVQIPVLRIYFFDEKCSGFTQANRFNSTNKHKLASESHFSNRCFLWTFHLIITHCAHGHRASACAHGRCGAVSPVACPLSSTPASTRAAAAPTPPSTRAAASAARYH
jgi:hypothetical protein